MCLFEGTASLNLLLTLVSLVIHLGTAGKLYQEGNHRMPVHFLPIPVLCVWACS